MASKHGNQRSLLNAGSIEIGRTTGRQRHGVGREGERERGGGGSGGLERRGTATKRRRARRASRAEEREPWERERKKETVGGDRVCALGVVRRRK